MALHGFNQTLTVAGSVVSNNSAKPSFTVKARSGDLFEAIVGPTTYYQVLTNLDNLPRDRVPAPDGLRRDDDPVVFDLCRYAEPGRTVFVTGIYQENGGHQRFEARTVYLLGSDKDDYLFEATHWWLVQISQMADRWLDHLFDARRSYTIDDFSEFYRTNLNITGQPTNDNVQENATLSRLIYGLSSAYLLTGADRYFFAAKAAVEYQRAAFRSLSHDGNYIFWAYGRRRNTGGEKGETLIIPSQNDDDRDTIPLYEQIYALAGLAQYYRITLDWEVLEDIRKTVNTFQAFFWDPVEGTERGQFDKGFAKRKGFAATGGYYSHIDAATMRPDADALGDNRSRKNWNSVGDHIPAYLINLILALDPIPQHRARPKMQAFLDVCRGILEETSELIVEKFPDPHSDYVNERFHADWTPDHVYKWQQNRAVVGHDLKIAWNLTRCAFYYQSRAKDLRDRNKIADAAAYEARAEKGLALARTLADRMAEVGLDTIRGGIYDAVARQPDPDSGMLTEFAWGATKDFWQQEQGILAYLILHGATSRDERYLELARECTAFWNLFFLDRDRQGIFFRTSENGLPIIQGAYAQKGGHSISGYHAFELNYLAHVYTRMFVITGSAADNNFCLYFRILSNRDMKSINVLPDFMPPSSVEIVAVRANGIDRTPDLKPANPNDFQIAIENLEGDPVSGAIELVVEFRSLTA